MGPRLDIMFSRQNGSDLHKLNGELKKALSNRHENFPCDFIYHFNNNRKQRVLSLEIRSFKMNTTK